MITMGRAFLKAAFVAGVFVIAMAASAQAQDEHKCELMPYVQFGGPRVRCVEVVSGITTEIQPTVYKFTEGVVHAPGSELAWLVLANFADIPQTVTAEFLVEGSTEIIWITETLAPHERKSVDLHSNSQFKSVRNFSTRVYWPGDGDTQLVMRPATDPFGRVTLPPPTVTPSAQQGVAH
jgi:hypothetical protein